MRKVNSDVLVTSSIRRHFRIYNRMLIIIKHSFCTVCWQFCVFKMWGKQKICAKTMLKTSNIRYGTFRYFIYEILLDSWNTFWQLSYFFHSNALWILCRCCFVCFGLLACALCSSVLAAAVEYTWTCILYLLELKNLRGKYYPTTVSKT